MRSAPRRRLRALIVASLLALCAPAAAGGLSGHLATAPRLLETPGGWRERLDERGLQLRFFLNQYTGYEARGGGSHDSLGASATLDLLAIADLETLGLVPGGRILVHGKSAQDENVNADVAALSAPFDDADFDEDLYMVQAWYEHSFWDGRVAARVGYLDQQVAFDRNAYANHEDQQFMSTFLDNNNAIVPLAVGLGANLFLRPTEWIEIRLGAGDADNSSRHWGGDTAFDGFSSLTGYAEVGFTVDFQRSGRSFPGHYRVGVFRDGAKRIVFGRTNGQGRAERARGHWGTYASFDQLVFRERAEEAQGLGVFGRYGRSDDDVNRIAHFWSAGFEYRGPVPGRDEDVLGLGVYQTLPSDRYRDEVVSDFGRETGVELYYQVQALPWLTVTPDFQFVDTPGGRSSRRDAIVLGLRLRLSL